MDNATRQSVAAVLELALTTWKEEQTKDSSRLHPMLIALYAAMDAGGVTPKDVSDQIRRENVEAVVMPAVVARVPKTAVPLDLDQFDSCMAFVEEVLTNRRADLESDKEIQFVESVWKWMTTANKMPSYKQRAWLNSIALRLHSKGEKAA